MFRLSRSADYAIRGLLYLSLNYGGGKMSIEEISRAKDIPASFLSKLFQTLAKKGFLRSVRGPEGGFTLTKPPRDINLMEVIEAVEGPIFLNDCLIQKGFCPQDEVCPVHDVWKETQRKFLDDLKGYNFEQLAAAGREKMAKK